MRSGTPAWWLNRFQIRYWTSDIVFVFGANEYNRTKTMFGASGVPVVLIFL